MKNALFLMVALMGFTSSSWAQEEDTLQIVVNGHRITIATEDVTTLDNVDLNGMLREFATGIQEAAAEMQAEMQDIKERRESGEITEEEAEAEMEASEEKFEARVEELEVLMETWGEAMEQKMEGEAEEWESWAEQWEDEAQEMEGEDPVVEGHSSERHIIIDEEGMRIEDIIREELKIDRGDGYQSSRGIFGFHFGWNTLYNSDMQLAAGEAEVDFFESWKYDLEFGWEHRFGSTSPIFFRYGLNFAWYSFETKEPLAKFPNPDGSGDPSVDFVDPGFTISEAEFDITYMDIPLMLRMDLSGKSIGDGFQLGIGGYGGVRLASDREIEYRDFNGDRIKERIKDGYLTNQWRYGVMGQIGYGSFHVTARYDLSQLFEDRFDTPDYQAATLTLGFVF